MPRYWVAVVSREHVADAVAGGFVQANHGREAPMRRLARDDRLLFYSPRETMRTGKPLKAFTALGRIIDDEPYRVGPSATFRPFRRKVHYYETREAGIEPLLARLSFAGGGKTWGLMMRRGFFEIGRSDYGLVAAAMGRDD